MTMAYFTHNSNQKHDRTEIIEKSPREASTFWDSKLVSISQENM
jgi:hypothetical protein